MKFFLFLFFRFLHINNRVYVVCPILECPSPLFLPKENTRHVTRCHLTHRAASQCHWCGCAIARGQVVPHLKTNHTDKIVAIAGRDKFRKAYCQAVTGDEKNISIVFGSPLLLPPLPTFDLAASIDFQRTLERKETLPFLPTTEGFKW